MKYKTKTPSNSQRTDIDRFRTRTECYFNSITNDSTPFNLIRAYRARTGSRASPRIEYTSPNIEQQSSNRMQSTLTPVNALWCCHALRSWHHWYTHHLVDSTWLLPRPEDRVVTSHGAISCCQPAVWWSTSVSTHTPGDHANHAVHRSQSIITDYPVHVTAHVMHLSLAKLIESKVECLLFKYNANVH